MQRIVKILDEKTLKKLTTKRLLAYKETLYRAREYPSWELTIYGGDNANKEITKDQPEWQAAMGMVKAILSKREHVSK